jgi:hypothetical protein
MSKTLQTLIKISKAQLDDKRKQLALLLDRKEGFIENIRNLEHEIEEEGKNLHKVGEEFRPSYINFIYGCRMKENMLLEEIFSEMKKFEIVKESRERTQEEELQRKLQLEIDEIAITSYLRKSEAAQN